MANTKYFTKSSFICLYTLVSQQLTDSAAKFEPCL